MAKIFRIHSKRQGQVTQTLKPVTVSPTAPPIVTPPLPVVTTGYVNTSLNNLMSSATGTLLLKGSLSKTLGSLLLSSTALGFASITRLGSLSKPLGSLGLSSQANLRLKASLNKTLGPVSPFLGGAIIGKLRIKGSVTKTLSPTTLIATGGTVSPLSLGANMPDSGWFNYASQFRDTAYSSPGVNAGEIGGFLGSTSSTSVPDTYRDSDGFVKALPPGEAAVVFTSQLAPTTAQRKLTWTSKAGGSNHGCATMVMFNGGSGVTVDLVNRSLTYTPTSIADGTSSNPPSFRYTMVSSTDYPVNFVDRPVVDDGLVLNPEVVSLVTAACSPSPVIRTMKITTVERNNSPIHLVSDTGYQYPNLHNPNPATEPGTQFNEPIYTAANRNKNKADAEYHDGLMVESLTSMVTALGGHLYYNVAQNADNTFYDAVAQLCADFSVVTGKDVYIEVGNEPWNFGYTWTHQLYNEAVLLGIGTEERYAQKVVEVANRFRTVFSNAGILSRLKIVAAWFNYGDSTSWDRMATRVGPTDWAKITHFAVAPYYGDNTNMGIDPSYTGSTATLKTAIQADIDDSISRLSTHLAKAISHGKKLMTYEGGPTTVLSNQAYKTTFWTSTDAYDLEMYYLKKLEGIAAGQTGGMIHIHYNLCYPLRQSNLFSWGLVEGITQTRSLATTPKLQAHTNFLAGIRS